MTSPPVVAVVGPTAAGKSDLAVDLALALGGEVVNADSMQVYRGMDIGTAKLSAQERRGVRHHLLDIFEVTRTATVAEFQGLAREAIEDCLSRDVVPVVVGGSALYVRAVLDRFEFPGTDPRVRERLEAELAEVGAASLHRRLAGVDPDAAKGILPSNGRRIVRALEVIEITGRPFASSLPDRAYVYDLVLQIGLEVPRPALDERIARRVDVMWDRGFVDEVRELDRVGLREGRTASRALGYAQVLEHLDDRITEDDARQATVAATRKFARRQGAWFDRDPRIRWIPYDADERVEIALSYHRHL